MENTVEKCRNIIGQNRYLSLATALDGTPWVAALAYAVDHDYNFYYYSAKDSLHSKHISGNPRIAMTIYDSRLSSDEVDGVQASGVVSQVSISELPHVIAIYYMQVFSDEIIREKWKQPVEAFHGIAKKRFYKISLDHIYKLDLETIEVDQRVEIDIEELRRIPPR